jgi:hypothetical protein
MANLSVSQNYHPTHPKPFYIGPENLSTEFFGAITLKFFNFFFLV